MLFFIVLIGHIICFSRFREEIVVTLFQFDRMIPIMHEGLHVDEFLKDEFLSFLRRQLFHNLVQFLIHLAH